MACRFLSSDVILWLDSQRGVRAISPIFTEGVLVSAEGHFAVQIDGRTATPNREWTDGPLVNKGYSIPEFRARRIEVFLRGRSVVVPWAEMRELAANTVVSWMERN